MLFVLRQRHLDALTQVAREAFEDRIVAHVRFRGPDICRTAPDSRLRARIGAAIDEAGRHGITAERDVAFYVRLLVVLEPASLTARLPRWARQWLARHHMVPRRRLNRILTEGTARGYTFGRIITSRTAAPQIPEG